MTMTMNMNQAADQVRQLAVRYESMVMVADALDKLGSIENAIKDAEKRGKQASVDEALAVVARDDALRAAKSAKAAVELEFAERRAAAIVGVAEAEENATRIVSGAKREADSLVDAAKVDALASKKAMTEAVSKANIRLTAIKDDAEGLEREIATRSAELAEIEGRLDKARAAMAAMLAA